MKISADKGECYPPRPRVEVDNTLRDLQNSIIALLFTQNTFKLLKENL